MQEIFKNAITVCFFFCQAGFLVTFCHQKVTERTNTINENNSILHNVCHRTTERHIGRSESVYVCTAHRPMTAKKELSARNKRKYEGHSIILQNPPNRICAYKKGRPQRDILFLYDSYLLIISRTLLITTALSARVA